ncbi:MAG: DUF6159 family protein [Longimicrobiales bacterium]
MAGSFSNSWTLVKESARVLKMDKELMVFPLMSGIATLMVTATFVAPLFLTGGWEIFGSEGGDTSYAGVVVGFLFYLAQYTVIFFFNAALVGAALIRMDGGDPTVSDGLGIAVSRMPTILGYAAIAATVGMVLRFISERSGFLGRLAVGLVGMGWTLATYLTVPVLVTRDLGPIDAVKESAGLFGKTWGEQVVGSFGMGWAFVLMGLSWTLVSVGGLVAFASLMPSLSPPLVIAWLGVIVLGYVFLALFSSALNGVYTAALYRYASTGESGIFDESIVGHAFRQR